jgi:hypothetical protein
MIGFQISEPGFVSLIVYDVLGNKITELVNERKQTGYYEVEFNSSNALIKNNLSSGIYFYRLTINGLAKSKSMLLLK